MKSIELARALAAAMSLRLPGTVGKIANKMRYIDSKAPLFVRGGIIRSIESRRFDRVYAVGVSSKSRSMPALGGMLYGAAALRHDIVVSGNQVTEGFQDSRVDINDMNFLDASERLAWKEYILVYQLLTDLLDSDTKPDVIFVDIPLLVPRAEQSLSVAEPDVEEEWHELIEVMEAFWQRFLPSIYPNDPNGPFLVSLQSRRDLNAAVLNALREKGPAGSPEAISSEALDLVQGEWVQLRRVGVLRFLRGALRAGHRTAAYYYEALGRQMKRFEPRTVANHGLIGFHIQVGLRTPIWKIETVGAPGQWDSEALDRLASITAFLTLNDNPRMKPLPLWYAEQLVMMPREVLSNYLRSTLGMLKDRAVDRAWLEGVDTMDEE
ncbi:hypothetical protein ACFQ73_03790 [Amycolatopsis japonica]|uniref:NurA domain-containing protein n=1 Tax=Amycolatopsis keratiniphila subsp. keratiniphila TaxID=227715 RepID=A0A1W2LHV5_9PSEU|nr:hypothetical protein [Amycolatopsis keratiniphila]ONF62202.1 hypothetical protein AVR91_0238175 [Amycolatopsis keratiniphila subsp. keratiniphila]